MDEGVNLPSKAGMGIVGLDDILVGGLTRNRLFLAEGSPGTGKTTLALQFLLEGARTGEKGLYITLSETEQELREAAASHGWSIGEKVEIYELAPPESLLARHPAAKPLVFLRSGTRRDHKRDFRHHPEIETPAHRA